MEKTCICGKFQDRPEFKLWCEDCKAWLLENPQEPVRVTTNSSALHEAMDKVRRENVFNSPKEPVRGKCKCDLLPERHIDSRGNKCLCFYHTNSLKEGWVEDFDEYFGLMSGRRVRESIDFYQAKDFIRKSLQQQKERIVEELGKINAYGEGQIILKKQMLETIKNLK